VAVANEFRPGHPIVFWLAIVVLTFAFFSAAKAGSTLNKCDGSPWNGQKHWQVMPPQWLCGSGSIELHHS
jgi:hypothetical protein